MRILRILIADDHPVFLQGLRQILEEEPDMVVGGEANDGDQVLQKVREGNWDAVVLDITMPGRSGIEVLPELRRDHPKLPVLILSMHPEDQFALMVLKEGAAGYLTKQSAPEEIVKAVRKAVSGGKYVSHTLAEKLAFHLETDYEKPRHEQLSERERQIMLMLASGRDLQNIADTLMVSVKTVSSYRTRILAKMKMKNNVELARYAIQHRLID